MDQLSKDMIACEKAGFGVQYGRWKATQQKQDIVVKKTSYEEEEKRCEYCRKVIKNPSRRTQRFCSMNCSALFRYYKRKDEQNGKE